MKEREPKQRRQQRQVCECPEGPLTDEDVGAYGHPFDDDDEPEFCWRCRRYLNDEDADQPA